MPVFVGKITENALTQEEIDLYEQKIVSSTDFASITDALADPAVANAQTGDFVKVDGDYVEIVKTNPTVAGDFLIATNFDHGSATGLGADDHTQYHNDSRADTWLSGKDTDNLDESATRKYMTTTEKTKLTNIETGATTDQTDVEIKTAYENNTNTNAYTDAEKTKVGHISVTQAVDLDTIESDTNTNNAKVTNATHAGEVVGSGVLTLDDTAISNKTSKTVTGAEELLINDGGTLKKTTAQSITNISSNIIGGVGAAGASQTVAPTTETVINFTKNFDILDEYDNGTHQFTADSDGKYLFICKVTHNSVDTAQRKFTIYYKINGTSYKRMSGHYINFVDTYHLLLSVEVLDLSAGDTVVLTFYHNSSSDIEIKSQADGTQLAIMQLQ